MPRTALLCLLLAIMSSGFHAKANGFIDSLPRESTAIDGSWQPDSVANRLLSLPLTPIEGLWRMSDDGAILAIERHSATAGDPTATPHNFRIVMVQSPTRHPRPGTLVGHAVTTAKAGVYEARIYTGLTDRLRLERPRGFIMNLNAEENRFTLTPVRSGLRVNLWRMIPYMFRFSVRVGSNRPDDIDGAVRIFPLSDADPITPRYL